MNANRQSSFQALKDLVAMAEKLVFSAQGKEKRTVLRQEGMKMKYFPGEMEGLFLSRGPWHQTCIKME